MTVNHTIIVHCLVVAVSVLFMLCRALISEARDVMPSRELRDFSRFLSEQNPAQPSLAIRQDRLGCNGQMKL